MTTTAQVFSHKQVEAIKAEAALLGACVLERGAFERVAPLLKAQDFQKPLHADIWAAMERLSANGTPIDLITVTNITANHYEVAALTQDVAATDNTTHHAYIIKENSLRAQLLAHAMRIHQGLSANQDPFALLESIAKEAARMTERLFEGRTATHCDTVDAEMDLIIHAMTNQTPEPRTNTEFHALDTLLNGLKKGGLYILAARPAMGKTALALNIAANVCKAGGRVAFFSLEMSRSELLRRLLASEGNVLGSSIANAHKLSNNDAHRLADAAADVRDWRLLTDDNASATVVSIRSQCAHFQSQNNGLDLVVVDYLQLMSDSSKGNREQEISAISRGLKVLAKDLGVPVIALSQLSRNCENRPDKRPMLSDLRESGAIEQDADGVLFVFRPEVYFEEDEEGNSTKGKAEIICAKNRHGATGSIDLNFIGHYFKFTNL